MKLRFEIVGDCWEFNSVCTDNNGYPMVTLHGVQDRAYRHSFTFFKGKIPKGLVIRHVCDNRLCINPSHLTLGSHKDNVMDRVERDRSAKGEKNGRSKLTEEQVLTIYKDNITPRSRLANMFNVDPKVIRDIKNRKTWKYLTK